MLRLLFWIALIAAAVWLWRKFKAPASGANTPREQDAPPWSAVPIAAYTCPATAR